MDFRAEKADVCVDQTQSENQLIELGEFALALVGGGVGEIIVG